MRHYYITLIFLKSQQISRKGCILVVRLIFLPSPFRLSESYFPPKIRKLKTGIFYRFWSSRKHPRSLLWLGGEGGGRARPPCRFFFGFCNLMERFGALKRSIKFLFKLFSPSYLLPLILSLSCPFSLPSCHFFPSLFPFSFSLSFPSFLFSSFSPQTQWKLIYTPVSRW